jgi:hypothetical protein
MHACDDASVFLVDSLLAVMWIVVMMMPAAAAVIDVR